LPLADSDPIPKPPRGLAAELGVQPVTGQRAAQPRPERSRRRPPVPHTRLWNICTIRCCSPECATPSPASRPPSRPKEKILIYGDYDVDGTVSVVILKKAIEMAGGEASFHVPHRLKETVTACAPT
jgi:hypothetical protein